METPNTEMLRGRVDIFVLKAISESSGYGYDILNYIHDKTEGHYEMKQSSVYSVLKRLEKQGYIYSFTGDESNGAKRRYYALTDTGKNLLEDQEREWAYTRTLLDNLVSGRSFDLKSDTPPFHPSDLRPMTRRAPKDEFVETDSTPEEEEKPAETSEQMEISPETEPPAIPETVPENTTEIQPVEEIIQSVAADVTGEAVEKEAVDSPVEPEEKTVDPVPVPTPVAHETPEKSAENTYRDFYYGLFGTSGEKPTARTPEPVDDYSEIDCSHINDLKMRLEDEGIKLRSYDPTLSSKSAIRYLLTNKIVRDTTVLGYLTLVIMLLIVGLVKSFAVSLTAILTVGGIALVIPAISAVIALNNPAKRVKDGVNLGKILLTGFIVYLTIFVINLIVNLIVPNGNSLNTAPTYAPAIIALCIPLSTIIFILLYKSEKYHLSNR